MSSSSTHPSSPGDDACRRLPRLSRLPVDGHTVSDETAVTTDEARAKLPGEPRNATDPIFSPRLVITLDKSTPAWAATFDFVLDIA